MSTDRGTPCPLCGWQDGLHDDTAIVEPGVPPLNCDHCMFMGSREELIARVEASALRFAVESPGLRDGTLAKRKRLHGVFVALLRAIDLDLAERLAAPIGRLADFHDATSRAIFNDAAADEAERLRRLHQRSATA